jgi:hypothetical protein
VRGLTPGHPVGIAAVLVGLAVALTGCSSSSIAEPSPAASSRADPAESGPAPKLLTASLHDTVIPQDDGRVSWTTTWRACFGPGPGDPAEVVGWQTQAVTSEGVSPEARDQSGGCVDLDIATGTDGTDAGMPGRDNQLSDAQALAYRARAVHADGTVTPWTEPVRVGTTTPAG